ncbi:MAG: amidohydrolase [Anaerolineae bacterium]|nr:amidohydrolase [Anaerolineae bacterium]MDW8173130.1 amidohydrolase [Anaerolineae bacterium]
MTTINFQVEAQAMREELIARRRDFHRHPELAFEEVRTAGIVAQALAELGLEVQSGVGKTGVVAMLDGAQDGPTVLVRADMDALPIQEANQADYASAYAGKMHACGHDGHTAIALGVAKLLSAHRNKLAGRVKFVFQPAEEVAGGAKAMIADGVLTNPRPDVTLGLHLWNSMPLGTLGVADGPVMAAASDFVITIRGRGGHGAVPQLAYDPIVAGAQVVSALQTIASRSADPLDHVVVSVCQFHSGSASNVIPETATLTGTFRTFRRPVRDLVEARMNEIVVGVARSLGCQADIRITHHTEPVSNDPQAAARARAAFQRLGHDHFVYERTMGSEDVGFLMTDIPGMYFFLGSANSERDLDHPHHHPRFDFDEEALPLGVALLSAAVADYLLVE